MNDKKNECDNGNKKREDYGKENGNDCKKKLDDKMDGEKNKWIREDENNDEY
jgi:hypothetical protein